MGGMLRAPAVGAVTQGSGLSPETEDLGGPVCRNRREERALVCVGVQFNEWGSNSALVLLPKLIKLINKGVVMRKKRYPFTLAAFVFIYLLNILFVRLVSI